MSGLMQEFKQEAGFAMRSPLLFGSLKNLSEENRYEFLDIMPASQGMLDYFSQRHCKLYLPACIRKLYALNTEELDTTDKLHHAFKNTLELEKHSQVNLNLIMLWDLPNFLDKGVLAGLIEYLLSYVHERVVLHTYIYTKRLMPVLPGHFYFIKDGNGEDRVWFENKYEVTRKCPVYYQEVLQKSMYPFQVQRSILLSNGLQEYTLVLKSDR